MSYRRSAEWIGELVALLDQRACHARCGAKEINATFIVKEFGLPELA